MGKAAGNAPLDRDIRRAVALTLWVAANGRAAPARTMGEAPDAADEAAVELIDLYEAANDRVLVDLYDDWRKEMRPADASAEHFGALLARAALGNTSNIALLIIPIPVIPSFTINLDGDELVWTGDAEEHRRNPTIPSQREYLGETLGEPEINPSEEWWIVARGAGTNESAEWAGKIVREKFGIAGHVVNYSLIIPAPRAKALEVAAFIAKRAQREAFYRDAITTSPVRRTDPPDARTGPRRRNPSLKPGELVAHATHGYGTVKSIEGLNVTVTGKRGEFTAPRGELRVGRPPGVPNPGHQFAGRHVVVWPRRTPTIDEIAAAYSYCLGEYRFPEQIDGEMWAEGLAFSGALRDLGPAFRATPIDRAEAQQMKAQLTDIQWQQIAARADYLRFEQGDPPYYAPEAP